MLCPNCSKQNADSAGFCIFCGTPLTRTTPKQSQARFKGALSSGFTFHPTEEKTPYETSTKDNHGKDSSPAIGSSRLRGSLGGKRIEIPIDEASYDAKPAASNNRAQFGRIQSRSSTKEDDSSNTSRQFCTKCGRPLNSGDNRCPNCDPGLPSAVGAENKTAKPWIIVASIAAVLLIVIAVSLGTPRNNADPVIVSRCS